MKNKDFNKVIPLFIFALSAELNAAESVPYTDILVLSAQREGDFMFRYIQRYSSQCFQVETLSATENYTWKIKDAKNFCKIDNKTLDTDFTDASFQNIITKSSGLELELSITPLREFGERIRQCTIEIKKGRIGNLQCGPEHKK